MADRLILAYALMFLMVVGVATVIWWHLHHSHQRTYKRRVAAEHRAARRADKICDDLPVAASGATAGSADE